MTNDLVTIIRSTERSLSKIPEEHTQLELFTSDDERVLSNFLIQENRSRTYLLRYKEWRLLNVKPESYRRPLQDIENTIRKYPQFEAGIRALTDFDLINHDELQFFGDLPKMFWRLIELRAHMYELTVAYAKQIAAEKDMSPHAVVGDEGLRDEIYRRIIPTREQFEWYHDSRLQMKKVVISVIHRVKEKSWDEIEGILDELPEFMRSIISIYAGYKFRKLKIPSEHVINSYFRDEINYNKMRAERVYGPYQHLAIQNKPLLLR